MDDLIEMWQTQNTIDLYLLSNLPEGGLSAIPSSGGMSVGQLFAHMNDLRLRWASNAAPDLTAQLIWFEKQPDQTIDSTTLTRALDESGKAIEALIRHCAEQNSGVKDFPGSPASFLGYVISHEAYHLGEIGLALTQAGLPLDKDVALGLWRGWWGQEPA